MSSIPQNTSSDQSTYIPTGFSGSTSYTIKKQKKDHPTSLPSTISPKCHYLKIFGYPAACESEVFSFVQSIATISESVYYENIYIRVKVNDDITAQNLLALNGTFFPSDTSRFIIGVARDTDPNETPAPVKITYLSEDDYYKGPTEYLEKKKSFFSWPFAK